mgnify:CR=1 FL=1
MTNPVTLWHSEHERFARLLDFLDTQMTAFHAGEHPPYDLMRDAVYYLHHYADRFHHPREDVAFARLAASAPATQLAINRLLQEHRVITTAGEALLKLLDDILEDAFIERTTLEAAAATYLVYYRHHIATENSQILPLAAQTLTGDDWAAVAAAVPAGPDPLFGDDIGARYRDLRAQIARES